MSIEVLNETDVVLDEMELVACSRYVLEAMKGVAGELGLEGKW